MRRASTVLACAAVLTLGLASPAHAHLMSSGFGPFYDGLLHLFVTPEDLLPVIALALLAGLRGPRYGRAVLFVLPTVWLAGSLAGTALAPLATTALAPAVATIALGALVALDGRLPLAPVVLLASALGLLNGNLNGLEWAAAGSPALSAAGCAAAIFVVAACLSAEVTALRAAWTRIAVRVAGSWIAAIGLLMLGWSLRAA